VTAQVPATQTAAAQTVAIKANRQGNVLVFRFTRPVRLAGKASLAFSVAGSKFKLVLEGISVLNGAAVTGKVTLEGTGTIAVNGQTPPADWAADSRVTLLAHPPAPAKTTTQATTTAPTTTS
jgi:hypothetical protein